MIHTLFLKSFFLDPRATGALFPSSTYLAKEMAASIKKDLPGYVIELGPGTGVITKAILEAGISDQTLVCVELAHDFTIELQKEFPQITLIEGDASQLSDLVKDKKPVHTIISSLPLRSFSKAYRELIFSEITKTIMPGGRFIQFTYSFKKDTGYYPDHFKLTESFIVWRNIPPARVTIFEIMK